MNSVKAIDLYEENKNSIQFSKSPQKQLTMDSPPKSTINDETQNSNIKISNYTPQQIQNSMSMDNSIADPFRALCRMKEEFIFVFSGFNDTKLLSCELFDVQRGIWKEIAQIGKARTKFSAVPISKSRILLFGGK